MNDSLFIKRFATEYEIEKNRFSCLLIALTDARKLTGRNLETGHDEFNILQNRQSFLNPYSFIGIINYLLFLEMIGEIFKLKSFQTKKTNNIYKSLKQFDNSITERDIYTIIALRNSIAHNYALVNIPRNQKENSLKRHKFTIDNSDSCTSIIQYPKSNWNGDFCDKSVDSSTIVSSIQLINHIELVYQNLVRGINDDSIELSLSKGVEELKARFTIIF